MDKEQTGAFQVTFKQEEEDSYRVHAGIGCVVLSLGWLVLGVAYVVFEFCELFGK